MNPTAEIIGNNIKNRDTLFVFPAEITAAFWRRESICHNGSAAVEAERFLSWDRFKENNFKIFRTERPSNSLHRTLFIYQLLEENRSSGDIFKGIIASEFAENSPAFLNYIVRILPQLGSFVKQSGPGGSPDFPFFQTLHQLYHRYMEFLSLHDMFEPGFEKADLSEISGDVILFFPELLEDYIEYEAELSEHPKIILQPAQGEAENLHFRYFSNTLHEFDFLFQKISELLDSGEPAWNIAVTVADNKILPYFLDGARRHSLPFTYRGGKEVNAYPSGRFFLYLKECADSGFQIDNLKKLLLSSCVPWKGRGDLERIIILLFHSLSIADELNSPKRRTGRYSEALLRAGEKRLADLLTSIQRGVREIEMSGSFQELQQRIIKFSTQFFYSDWEDENRRVFEYVLNELPEMEKALAGFQIPENVSCFDLFLQFTGGMIYVPRNIEPGIPLYPYRVAAGISPHFHFVISAHHSATRIPGSAFSFLRKDQKEMLGLVDREMGNHFLKAFGSSGRDVWISCSGETFSEKTLIPPYFMDRLKMPLQKGESTELNSPLNTEKRYWKGGTGEETLPHFILPLQARGLGETRDFLLRGKRINFTRDPVKDIELRKTLTAGYRKGGVLTISPTGLERYTRCPFAFLLTAALGCGEEVYQPEYLPPHILGKFLHEALRSLYSNPGVFDGEQFLSLTGETVQEMIKRYYSRGYLFIPPVEDELKGRSVRWIGALIDLDRESFPGFGEMVLEKDFSADIPIEGDDPGSPERCILHGKIDRLSGNGDEWIIIDYKTTLRVKKGQLGGDGEVPPESFQIPLYIYLAEQNGYPVCRAGYISLSTSQYTPALKSDEDRKGWFDRGEIEDLMVRAEGYVRSMAAGLERGSFPTSRDCAPCTFRAVCREKYNIS